MAENQSPAGPEKFKDGPSSGSLRLQVVGWGEEGTGRVLLVILSLRGLAKTITESQTATVAKLRPKFNKEASTAPILSKIG